MDKNFTLEGNRVNVLDRSIQASRITVENGIIREITKIAPNDSYRYLVPGFVDAHVHIESSMLAPTEFARAAVVHGVVASVSDPHEIANVLGRRGVLWMVENGQQSPFKFHFGAPSCVPATPFETAGACFELEDIEALLDTKGVHYLAEVMNFPAVINGDPRMSAIIQAARKRGLRIDGHAPAVMGDALNQYAAAGIETDHECVNEVEARARLTLGMKVALREGSAARNFAALYPILRDHADQCFFCSDDKHPDDLVQGYLNQILARAVANGIDPITALQVATVNPVRHYGLNVGLLQVNDPADFVEIEDLKDFKVIRTWIDGNLVAEQGASRIAPVKFVPENNFHAQAIQLDALQVPWHSEKPFPTILAEDGQLITGREDRIPKTEGKFAVSDPEHDHLKIVVVNRYSQSPPVVGFIRNFGLKTSALAGSVAHDSHNIVAVGANDTVLLQAINQVIAMQGGLSFASPTTQANLPLPIAGLMSDQDAWTTAKHFERLTALAQADGCPMRSPYMTLSFMALLVIPNLKIGDKGLFDVNRFELI